MTEYATELAPYTGQVTQASNHTEHLVASVTSLALGLGAVKAVAGGSAAQFQQMAAGMRASSTVTHQSVEQLSGSVRSLQRDFPLATQAALATVQSVQALGLTAKNQVGQVGALSKTMTQLAGATGSAGPALAASFGQLTRQMASLDPRRVQAFSDSLTALHARSGASALSIAQFAQSLAPMAQAAGLGQTSVMGIATSFAKVGQDGYVAANTVSKMMSDMSRSVRDGSNDMAGYANVVGMTAKQFSSLFRNNPAEAITRVSEAISKMPTGQGQRALEMLGIEGVRSQRALLSVAQSGGMRADIATAVNSYGSGATATASAAAYRGVSDSLSRLQSATEQVTTAFERPLLGAVSHIVDATSVFTRGVGGIAGSRPVQGALGLASTAALPILGARLLSRGLSTGALGSFLLRSGPVTGALAGFGAGRAGGTDDFIPRTQATANMIAADMAVREGADPREVFGRTRTAAAVNSRLFNLGAGLGAAFPGGAGGGSLFRQVRGFGVLGASAAVRSQAEMFRLARMDPIERDTYRMAPYGSGTQRAVQNIQNLRDLHGADQISRGTMLSGIRKELSLLAAAEGEAGTATRTLAKSLGVLSAEAGKTAMAGGRAAVGGLAKGAFNMLGGTTGMVMMGGMALYEGYQHHKAAQQEREAHYSGLDMFGTVNAYRDAMGQAGEATQTLSGQMDAAAKSVSAAITTITQATSVSGADTAAATRNRNVVQQYSGNEAQVAAQIRAVDTRGLKPSDLQGAKLDLIRLQQTGGLAKNFNIEQALQMAAGGQGLGGQQIDAMVAGMSKAKGAGSVGFGWDWLKRGPNFRGAIAMADLGHTGYGEAHLGKGAQSQVDLLAGALQQQQADTATRFGNRYSTSQELRSADRAIAAARRTGNADLVVGMEQELSNRLTGKTLTGVSADDIKKAGGFSALLAQHGRRVNNIDVASLLGGAGKSQVARVEDSVAQTLLGTPGSQGMGRFFSNFHQGGGFDPGRRALTAAANAPEDLEKQNKAIMAIVDSGTKAGMSLADLASQAAHTTSTMADGDARRAVMVGVIAEATRRLQNSMGGMTIGQRFGAQAQMATQLSNTTGNSPEAVQARKQGNQQAADLVQNERQYMQQRIMAQFQFQVQSQRSYHDYYLGVSRANEDFNLNLTRSDEDFNRQRLRATRDFNIQRQREIQDASKTLYNPYERIAAKPVYDAGNLLMNMREQLQAMRQQSRNIARLRRMGLSEGAIRTLGLYDPNNAQQVQQLVNDMASDHSLVGQFNTDISQRAKAAGNLLSEDPSFKRQKADFQRQLRDSATDYQIARDRQLTDFHKTMARQATDFQTQMARMQEDLTNADRELTGNMASLQRDMNKILHGQTINWMSELKNNMRDTVNYIAGQQPALRRAQGGGGGGGGSTDYKSLGALPGGGTQHWGGSAHSGNRAVTGYKNVNGEKIPIYGAAGSYHHDYGKVSNNGQTWKVIEQMAAGGPPHGVSSVMSGKHANGSYHYKGEAVDFVAGSPQAMGEFAHYMAANFGHRLSELIWNGPGAVAIKDGRVVNGQQFYGSTTWADHKDHVHVAASPNQLGDIAASYASGGIATREHVGRVAEAGVSEAMIPLDERGVHFLASAFADYLGANDARVFGGGGRGYSVEVHGNVVYDHSVQFPGAQITVPSDDPHEFARKAEAKARRDNLTSTRGVSWSRS